MNTHLYLARTAVDNSFSVVLRGCTEHISATKRQATYDVHGSVFVTSVGITRWSDNMKNREITLKWSFAITKSQD